MIILLTIWMIFILVNFIFDFEIVHFYELFVFIIMLMEIFIQLLAFYGNLTLMCFFVVGILFCLIVALNLILMNAFRCWMICLSCFMSLLVCISLIHVITVSYTTCRSKKDYSYAY